MGVRVCILTTVHYVFDTRIFHKQAKSLVKAGYEVVLIAQHDKEEVVDEVRIVPLPRPKNRFEQMLKLTWRALILAVRERADVYHFHDPELLPVGILLKMLTKARVIYDVHEDYPESILTKRWIPEPLRRLIAKTFDKFEKLASRFIDGLVVATDGIAEKFRELNPVIVRNYPVLEMFPQSDAGYCSGKEKILVYIGLISKLRGAVEMVKAVEILSSKLEVKLRLIGKFDTEKLKQELENMPGFAKVEFLGWHTPDKVYNFLKDACVGLVCLHPEPRYVEALPVKLFEYMASGLPIVASNLLLWKEIVEENGCGVCQSFGSW